MRWVVTLVLLALGAAWGAALAERNVDYPTVVRGVEFRFPRDHGAHPAYRTEWWYFTGWLEGADGKPLGFQITFFRSRPSTDPANPSAFAPKQVVFAHAALSDPIKRKLIHDQRTARAGFGIAGAAEADANVVLLDWNLVRTADGVFRARTPARDFSLDLALAPTQPVMANGDRGYSRKGPRPEQASYYYSVPQLAVSGTVIKDGRRIAVTGRAWLDREWSSTLLDPVAVGWDWAGLNLDDGGALMAFQIRGRDGRAVHAGGTLRRADGNKIILAPEDVRFVPRRRWRSPQTGAVYPVEADFIVRLPEGVRRFPLKPLFDAQELDGRASGMPVYWEGAVSTPGGRGYLELTGYADALRL
ncbi:lipocalin-like domain-containing protein [Sphingomonas cavernae]|uniref:Carotenoid 1,2-hydratase n=1 Tax=Sphingomonas cavernae TaxID=2320861 RepID=A0A418WR80_9SPHN|nr:carotenoid 1,2-hydratase [Sphingomonas cavernae]RJF93669.1 carotenoid 1,2-hydratase [Sphingomonas cavernae]